MSKAEAEKRYLEQLDDIAPDYESDEWIIGGERRESYAARGKYGRALRRYAPTDYEVGFHDFCRENYGRIL